MQEGIDAIIWTMDGFSKSHFIPHKWGDPFLATIIVDGKTYTHCGTDVSHQFDPEDGCFRVDKFEVYMEALR